MEKFDVTGMTCAACSAHVERAVRGVEGVKEVTVSLLTNSMTVDFSSPATAEKILRQLDVAEIRVFNFFKLFAHCYILTGRKSHEVSA